MNRLRLDTPRETEAVSSLPALKLLLAPTEPFLLRRIDFDLAKSFPRVVSAMVGNVRMWLMWRKD